MFSEYYGHRDRATCAKQQEDPGMGNTISPATKFNRDVQVGS